VLNLARLAREEGKAHVYLGFRINDCASMSYKAGFRPHELLAGRPGPDEAPYWAGSPKRGATRDGLR
jgi:arginyl-tRNA--protein-N-Asp/Glu arginylyltransferase